MYLIWYGEIYTEVFAAKGRSSEKLGRFGDVQLLFWLLSDNSVLHARIADHRISLLTPEHIIVSGRWSDLGLDARSLQVSEA